MAAKSTAEWCKKYRRKHKEVYREKDALRKETIAKKWTLIQLLTKKGYEFSERENKNISSESKKV